MNDTPTYTLTNFKGPFFFDLRVGSEASHFLAHTHFKDACGTFPDYLSFHFDFLPSPGHGASGGLKRKVCSSFIEELERINTSQSHEEVFTQARDALHYTGFHAVDYI